MTRREAGGATNQQYIDEYWEVMRKYEGFETRGMGIPMHSNGLMPTLCGDGHPPCCGLVVLYAKLGLHRYNFLQGKNFQFRRVKKYNKTFGGGCVIFTFYITLEAEDPAIPGSLQIFQTRVTEGGYRKLLLSCGIARPLVDAEKDPIKKTSLFCSRTYGGKFLYELMPELPSENPFNTNRFCVLEQQAHDDWIQLYLDLAVATTKRTFKNEAPTNLKILNVSMETTPDPETPSQGRNVYDATFYIRYEDPCEARVGKDVDRVAIIRRIFDKNTGCLRLVGRNESSATILPEMVEKNPCEALVGKDVD